MSTEVRRSGRQKNGPREIKQKEIDSDEEFWNQDAFAEDEDDESFDENQVSDKGEVWRDSAYNHVHVFTATFVTCFCTPTEERLTAQCTVSTMSLNLRPS